jgi:hypothetical protein
MVNGKAMSDEYHVVMDALTVVLCLMIITHPEL